MSAILLLTYAVVMFLAISNVRRINFSRVNFADGIYVGFVYFLAIPLIIGLYDGKISDLYLNADAFRPLQDGATSVQIFIGILGVVIFHYMHGKTYRENYSAKNKQNNILAPSLLAYFAVTLFDFLNSGKLAGGHWQQVGGVYLSNGLISIVVANFSNVYRAAIFGIIYEHCNRNIINKKMALIIGASCSFFDLFLSFNRITLAYFIVMFLLLYRKNFFKILIFLIPAASVAAYASFVWTYVRALALTNGYTLEGFLCALDIVNDGIESGRIVVGSAAGSIFESSNIIVFNWLVENTGGRFPLLYGTTFFLRPATILLPSVLWPAKPYVFGVYVGHYLQGADGLSLNATLFGEAFGNFSYFWPMPLLAMLLALGYAFRQLSKRWPFVNTAAFFLGFALWRFDISFGFISFVSLVALIWFIKSYQFCFPKKVVQHRTKPSVRSAAFGDC